MDETDVPSSAKMSSQHFEEEDYLVTGQSKRLKGSAVPSSNLQIIQGEESKGCFEFINVRMDETDGTEENNEETDDTEVVEPKSEMEVDADCNSATSNNSWTEEYDIKPELQSIKIERCSVERDSEVTNNGVSFKDAEVQAGSDDVLTCFSNIKKNSDISVVTGIKSFAILKEIALKLEVTYSSKYEIPGRRFKTFDRVILTFARLKHDLSYDMLSILFQCSIEDCERIFLETEERLRNYNLIPKHFKVSPEEYL